MATRTEIDRNNVLRRQALARAQVLRRQALRGGWDAVEGALRRVIAAARSRPARVA